MQVEHPVTELITGLDLVEQQIKIARGEQLAFNQSDLSIIGHAVEVRVYAEDPLDNFMPSIGTLSTYIIPKGDGIRVDDGFEEGMTVPMFYDPMISKLITYGKTREEAIQLMVQAIDAYQVEGVETTLSFGKFVCEHDAFLSGNFDTHFVKNHYSPEALTAKYEEEKKIAAMVGLQLYLEQQATLKVPTAVSQDWKQNRS